MSQSSELVRGNLLSILNDNTFHSGETLGATLGISCAAISNHIKVLSSLGLDILSIAPIQPLEIVPFQAINDLDGTRNSAKNSVGDGAKYSSAEHQTSALESNVNTTVIDKPTQLGDDLKQREFEIIVDTLREEKGSRKNTAQRLGISPRTLRYKLAKMREVGLNLDEVMDLA